MKRFSKLFVSFVVLALVATLCLSMVACGSEEDNTPKSTVTVSDVQTELRSTDSDITLADDDGDGIYTYSDGICTMACTTENGVVTNITMMYTGTTSAITSRSSISSLFAKDTSRWTRSDIRVATSALLAFDIYAAVGGDTSGDTFQIIADIYSGVTKYAGNWTISGNYSSSGTGTVTAKFSA